MTITMSATTPAMMLLTDDGSLDLDEPVRSFLPDFIGAGKDEVTVAFITGAGLKTQEAVIDTLEPPLHVEPTIASFEEAFGERREADVQAASA